MKNRWHQEIMRVQYKDTDQMGIVHHGNYVNWFEVARTEWMRYAGIAYSKMESMGLLLPVLDVSIQYRKPAHFDERIAVYTKVANFSPIRLQFQYEARRVDDAGKNSIGTELSRTSDKQAIAPHGELIASGTTLHMWVNRKWKPARIDKLAPEVYALLQSHDETGMLNN